MLIKAVVEKTEIPKYQFHYEIIHKYIDMLPLNEEAITKNYKSYQIHFEVILNWNCYFLSTMSEKKMFRYFLKSKSHMKRNVSFSLNGAIITSHMHTFITVVTQVKIDLHTPENYRTNKSRFVNNNESEMKRGFFVSFQMNEG